jgi:glycosyltransferase involved in cell wall biosynthesis
VNASTLVVTVSTPLKHLLAGIRANTAHVLVVPNGANPQRFRHRPDRAAAIRERYGLGNALVVGWVGILRKWHRLEVLFDALGRIPSIPLLVIGDGPDRPRLDALVDRHDMAGRVVFTGRLRHDEVADHLSAVDVAVVSGDRTGFASPMKLLEYMAMGRAVVAPRLRNIEDIVEDGRDGLLFRRADPVSLAAVLKRLADDAGLRERLGRAARLKIERARNWRAIAETILGALGERGRAGHPTPGTARDWSDEPIADRMTQTI